MHSSLTARSADLCAAEAESRPKSAHRYNVAEQQQIYKSEIERIWKAQYDSLSRKDEPQLTEEDVREDARRQQTLAAQQAQVFSPTLSRGSSLAPQREGTPAPDQRRVLRIKRKVRWGARGAGCSVGLRVSGVRRWTASGGRKSSATRQSLTPMSRNGKPSRKRTRLPTHSHPQAMLRRTSV